MFYRGDERYRKNLEAKFFRSIENLRKFENSLAPWQREVLMKRVDGLKLDIVYSTNHADDPQLQGEERIEETVIEDPHINHTQKSRPDYSHDTEESIGSIEDYRRLKGI